MPFILTSIVGFLAYLVLTFPSGSTLGYWSKPEIGFGIAAGVIAAAIGGRLFCYYKNYRMLNPVRWVLFLIYAFGPFFIAMAKANIDVAMRVFTGKINPAIVKISPNLKTDLGITMLANSITLTPGTLTVDIDEDTNELYIHWIYAKELPAKIEDICGTFPEWVRRIAE
ncbi:MAG: Na+/H+ antiporter subunit E [Synergistetes bacterium]|nr:Na+/H+ antiporter subunit E [Synergistota bacterium]